MTFDNETWWLVGLLLSFATGVLIYLLKRSLFGRVDRLDDAVKKLDETMVKKDTYEKDKDKLTRDIEHIERNYTPRNVHDKCYDELRADIKKSWKRVSQKMILSVKFPNWTGRWI